MINIGKWVFGLLLLCLASTTLLAKNDRITISIPSDTIDQIYLYKHVGSIIFDYDTLKVKRGKSKYIVNENFASGLYRIGFSKENSAPVVISNEEFKIQINSGIVEDSIEFIDSPNNDFYQKYLSVQDDYENGLKMLDQLYGAYVRQYGQGEELQELVAGLRSQVDSLKNVRIDFFENSVAKYNSRYVKMVSQFYLDEEKATKEDFVKEEYFNDVLAKGDFIHRKINNYILFHLKLNQENVAIEMTNILSNAPKGTDARKVVYTSVIGNTLSINQSLAKQFLKAFEWEYPNSDYVAEIKNMIPKGPLAEGDEAPEISLKGVNGEKRNLSDLRGKVVLLDFWASWCGPCRRENPNVVKLYNAYKELGFDVFSVSLDRNKSSWLKAIEKDNLSWENHVSELKHWDSQAARAYSVTGIPTTYLIDENGIIIGKNLRGYQLEQKLKEIYK